MEKFSTWRDKGTGISPFIPVDLPVTPVRKFLVGPILLLVKIPIFYILYVVSAIVPKPAFRAILSLFGFDDVDVLVEGVRRTRTEEIDRNRPGLNQVVISNWISPLDVFVLFGLSNVSSLNQVSVIIPVKNAIYRLTAWQTVSVFFGEDVSSVGEKVTDLSALKNQLVILFAEGTASNNRAVLPFAGNVLTILNTTGFTYKTVVLKLYPNSLTLPIAHLSKGQYLKRLLTHPGKAHIKVKIVPMEKASTNGAKQIFADNGLNTVELGVEQKAKFIEYYQSYALTNFTK